MSIAGDKAVIASAVNEIIPCNADIPAVITPPCAIVLPRSGDWNVTLPGASPHNKYELWLLLQKGGVIEEVQSALDTYLVPTGTTVSIKAAVEAADCSASCNFINVTGWRDYGPITLNEIVYLGVKFDIETY